MVLKLEKQYKKHVKLWKEIYHPLRKVKFGLFNTVRIRKGQVLL